MYAEGLGVPRDAVEAHMWLTIAASRSIGAEREQMLTARAAIAAWMTPTDVRDANRRAQAWHAAHQGMRNRAVPPSDPAPANRAWGRSPRSRKKPALVHDSRSRSTIVLYSRIRGSP